MRPSLAPIEQAGPALGLLELASIADGFQVADVVTKEALVELLVCRPVSPGKFLVLFGGEVSDVTSSVRVGRERAEGEILDHLLLPHPDPSLLVALNGTREGEGLEALGVVETRTVSTLLVAADIAVKTADVTLLGIRVAVGLGGKAFFTLTGEIAQVRAAVHAAAGFAHERGHLVQQVAIPRPHPSLADWLP